MRPGLFPLVAVGAILLQPEGAAAQTDWNRELVEVRDLSSLSLSPGGDRLLFRVDRADLASNVEQLAWMAVDTQDGRLSALGSAGEGLFDDPGVLREGAPKWLANGDAVVRQYDGKAIGIWRYEHGDSRFRPLIVSDSDILDFRLEPGDIGLAYQVAATRAEIRHAEEEERSSGVLIDQHVDLAQGLYRAGRVNGRLASQRLIGYWFMRAGLLHDAPRQWRHWDPKSGTSSALGPPSSPPPFVPPALDQVASLDGPGRSQVVAHWEGTHGRIEWQEPGGTSMTCLSEACRTLRASWLAWRVPGRELLVGLFDRFQRTTLALWSRGDNRLRILSHSEGLRGGSRHFSAPCAVGKTSAYCVAADPASPPKLVAIDLRTGGEKILFDPNTGLRRSYNAKVERMMLRLANGLPVAATILTGGPKQRGPRPFFVNYYRCDGFLRGGEGDEWPLPALLQAGFGVACLNGAPLQGAQNALRTYENGTQAVSMLVDQLAGRGLLDRNRVAMGGFSFGSEVAMWTAMKSHLLAAVSIASAQPEPADYWYGSILGPSHDKVMKEVWGLGDPDRDAAAWRTMAPAKNVAEISAPVLLQMPEQEARRVPELLVRLRNAGTPVELWAYPDEDHLKVEPRHRLAVYQRNLDWFRYWLQSWRDPDPAKAAQYDRWDRMRTRRSAVGRSPTS